MAIIEIQKWLRDKSIRIWKRSLFLLFDAGSMSFDEIAKIIGANRVSVYRTLKKLEVSCTVKSKKKNNKLLWAITDYGEDQIRKMQKEGMVPSRKRCQK